MPAYRLYCLDGKGKIKSADWIAASDDEQAIAAARAKKLDVPCELWDRKRLVAELPAHTDS